MILKFPNLQRVKDYLECISLKNFEFIALQFTVSSNFSIVEIEVAKKYGAVVLEGDYCAEKNSNSFGQKLQIPHIIDNKIHKPKKGFAAMTPERRKQIASMGGIAAHEIGVAHEWNAEQAKAAGQKGGKISGINRKANEKK